MLKIGIIGLGDIAQKAYLPLISNRKVELHLHTRNAQVLADVGGRYRITNLHPTIQSLIAARIQGAFVHTATASHVDIIEQLLLHDIHVFVDKPISYEYSTTEKLIRLAQARNLKLHVGFNRRMAPAYAKGKLIAKPNMIVMQKNRKALPGDVRTFVFDDFIHVVDTLLWLLDKPIDKIIVNGKQAGGLLMHVTVQFIAADGTTAIGIMNRDSGTVEERLEIFSPEGKHVVTNVCDTFHLQDRNEMKLITSDWEPTLHKRGFDHLIDSFLVSIEDTSADEVYRRSILYTHKVCEELVQQLEAR